MMLELAHEIGELGALAILSGMAISASMLMFKRLLESNDRLAPAIDRLSSLLEAYAENETASMKQRVELLEKIDSLIIANKKSQS